MKQICYTFIVFMVIGVVGCTPMEENVGLPTQMIKIIVTPLLSTPTPFDTFTESPTTTLTPTPQSTMSLAPTTTFTATISKTTSIPLGSPYLISTIEPKPYSFWHQNIWWSNDSKTLYYQDFETKQAWAYDVLTGKTFIIPYAPRSVYELAPQIESQLPADAEFIDLSPSHRNILYKIPLPEPIPSSENPDYSYTLWLRQDEQDIQLGLISSCFGLLAPPIWSENENLVVVNTAGSLGVPCLHSSWLIDLDRMSVGALDTPWEGISYYNVSDLSADGKLLLVRADMNYFYNRETKEKWPIPGADTNNIFFVEKEDFPQCVFIEVVFSDTFLEDALWYCERETGKLFRLGTFSYIVHWSISPNQKNLAIVSAHSDFSSINRDLPKGIWLLVLP